MGKKNQKRNNARRYIKAEQRVARQIMANKGVTYQEALRIMRNDKEAG